MKEKFLQELINEQRELTETLNAINVLINRYRKQSNSVDLPEHSLFSTVAQSGGLVYKMPNKIKGGMRPYHAAIEKPPSEFKSTYTQIQKVVYALNQIMVGDKYQVTDYLIGKGEKGDREWLAGIVGQHLSKMYRESLINAEKQGYKNRYSIKYKNP